VLAALREVEDALAASTREQERLGSLETAVSAARRGVELATERYRAGQVDFLNVLVAQRSLLAAEEAQVQSRHTLSVQAVALCKALGGGWSEERP
jgi:outer membrane protein TolC